MRNDERCGPGYESAVGSPAYCDPLDDDAYCCSREGFEIIYFTLNKISVPIEEFSNNYFWTKVFVGRAKKFVVAKAALISGSCWLNRRNSNPNLHRRQRSQRLGFNKKTNYFMGTNMTKTEAHEKIWKRLLLSHELNQALLKHKGKEFLLWNQHNYLPHSVFFDYRRQIPGQATGSENVWDQKCNNSIR